MILLIRLVYLWSFSKMDGAFLVVVLLVKSEVYSIEYDAMDILLNVSSSQQNFVKKM